MRGVEDTENVLNRANFALQYRWILPNEPLHAHPNDVMEDDEKDVGMVGVHSRQYIHFNSSGMVTVVDGTRRSQHQNEIKTKAPSSKQSVFHL